MNLCKDLATQVFNPCGNTCMSIMAITVLVVMMMAVMVASTTRYLKTNQMVSLLQPKEVCPLYYLPNFLCWHLNTREIALGRCISPLFSIIMKYPRQATYEEEGSMWLIWLWKFTVQVWVLLLWMSVEATGWQQWNLWGREMPQQIRRQIECLSHLHSYKQSSQRNYFSRISLQWPNNRPSHPLP